MESWMLYSVIASLFWGFWGFFAKLASRTLPWQNLLLLSYFGSFIVFIFYIIFLSKAFESLSFRSDHFLALLSGAISTVGALFFYHALSKGEASRIVVITSMYPFITVILAVLFLNEPLSIKKVSGAVFAVAAICLLSL
jgi:transporter family protein